MYFDFCIFPYIYRIHLVSSTHEDTKMASPFIVSASEGNPLDPKNKNNKAGLCQNPSFHSGNKT